MLGSGPSHDNIQVPTRFTGYHQGMSLRDAEPTRMGSDSSSDSDILDDNPRFSDLDHHDDHQDVLGTGLGVAPCSPQPCLLYTSPSPRDATLSRMPSSA